MNKKEPTSAWNPFDYFETQDEINTYLRELLNDDDPMLFVSALGHLAKKHGMSEVARAVGVNRESLYKSFNGSVSPRWDTIMKTVRVLNVDIFSHA